MTLTLIAVAAGVFIAGCAVKTPGVTRSDCFTVGAGGAAPSQDGACLTYYNLGQLLQFVGFVGETAAGVGVLPSVLPHIAPAPLPPTPLGPPPLPPAPMK